MVDYSSGGCKEGKYASYDVPEWTVTEVSYYNRKTPLKLKDLIQNYKNFKKRLYGDVINQMEYYDEESGIFIHYDKFTKEVNGIYVKPSGKDEQKFACDYLK